MESGRKEMNGDICGEKTISSHGRGVKTNGGMVDVLLQKLWKDYMSSQYIVKHKVYFWGSNDVLTSD